MCRRHDRMNDRLGPLRRQCDQRHRATNHDRDFLYNIPTGRILTHAHLQKSKNELLQVRLPRHSQIPKHAAPTALGCYRSSRSCRGGRCRRGSCRERKGRVGGRHDGLHYGPGPAGGKLHQGDRTADDDRDLLYNIPAGRILTHMRPHNRNKLPHLTRSSTTFQVRSLRFP